MDCPQPSKHQLFVICIDDKLFRDRIAQTLNIPNAIALFDVKVYPRAISMPRECIPDNGNGFKANGVSLLRGEKRAALKARDFLGIIEARQAILACAEQIAQLA